MARRWARKLGRGMAVIMAVSQMSGMAVWAAPEDAQNETEVEQAEYEEHELVHGVTITPVGGTTVTPHFNEAFTLQVQVTKDDDAAYTYEWYKDFRSNGNKLNVHTEELTVTEGVSATQQAYIFCVFQDGMTQPVAEKTFTVKPTNDLEAHVKGDPDSQSKNLCLPYGSSVTLSVEASAHDESNMNYTWRNVDIRNLVSGTACTDYTIDKVEKNDTYTCYVSDGISTFDALVDFIITIDNAFVAYPEGEAETETTKTINAETGSELTLKVIASCKDNSLGYGWGSKTARQSAYTTVLGAASDTYTVTVGSEEMYYRCSVYDQFKNNKQIVFIVKPVTPTPTTVAVTGVTLDKGTLELQAGESTTLTATVNPTDASNKNVSWSSSAPGVAAVSASGEVTAVSAGTATITARTEDGDHEATCAVTVTETEPSPSPSPETTETPSPSPETTGTPSPSPETTGTPSPSPETTGTPSPSPETTGTPSPSPETTGTPSPSPETTGTPSPSPETEPSPSPSPETTGTPSPSPETTGTPSPSPETTGTPSPSPETTETPSPSPKTTETPSPSPETTGTPSPSPETTETPSPSPETTGTPSPSPETTGTPTPSPSPEATGTPTPTPVPTPVKVTGVSLNKTTLNLLVGTTSTLAADVNPANAADRKVSWSSSDPAVAAVDENGTVTAAAAGRATITVKTADGGFTADCEVNVTEETIALTGIRIDREELTLTEGDTAALIVSMVPENATEQKTVFGSSDENVVTVDPNGKITAIGAGTATVTASTEDGAFTAACQVTVEAKPVVTSVSLNVTTLELVVGRTAVLEPGFVPEDAQNKDVTWSSSNEAAATVDENGKVTAVAAGTAVITVTTAEGGLTAECTVTVTEKTEISNNTFSVDQAAEGVPVINNSDYTLKLDMDAEKGTIRSAAIYDTEGNVAEEIDSYMVNIVTDYDTDGKTPKTFYTLVFTDGKWDTSYDSGTKGAYEYKGVEYFVAGGVVNQNANGLIYTGADGWRFLAAGHVVTGYEGLVMYADKWFWIDANGKCDENYAAIVDWNGAKFLVHGGRLRTDYTGFTYDPQNPGTWYHITAGQVWGDGVITDKSIEGGEITRTVVNGVVQ